MKRSPRTVAAAGSRPSMARTDNPSLTSSDSSGSGVEEYRRTFGQSVRHALAALFRRTLDRDGGAANWERVEIYLDENPARRPDSGDAGLTSRSVFDPWQELIASFENPRNPPLY